MVKENYLMTSRITFVPELAGISSIEDIQPKPMRNFIPDWWKKTPHKEGISTLNFQYEGNIKTCPSI